jgi:hypothetical protein
MKTPMEVAREEKPMPRLFAAATLFVILLGLLLAVVAPALAQDSPRIELGVNYTYVRANAPPGDCGCFSMNGGAGWLSVDSTHSRRWWAKWAASIREVC